MRFGDEANCLREGGQPFRSPASWQTLSGHSVLQPGDRAFPSAVGAPSKYRSTSRNCTDDAASLCNLRLHARYNDWQLGALGSLPPIDSTPLPLGFRDTAKE